MHLRFWVIVVAAFVGGLVIASGQTAEDAFRFLAPSVHVSTGDRKRLDAGEVIVRALPAADGHLAVFAAVRLDAPPSALITWTRAIEELKQGPNVLAIGRFSDPVADTDLDALTLEETELDSLKGCRVGSCDLKLAAAEIIDLQDALRAAGKGWREAAQRAFRRILINRVRTHRDRGLLALPPYADRERRMSVGEAFTAIVARSPYLTRAFPAAVNALLAPAHSPLAGESFYYWSRDRYGAGRPVVNLTYVRLLEPDDEAGPRALTISTQLFASHYSVGALGLTAVMCDGPGACYLAYLNRTQVDFLGGLFGGIKRALVEDRIESETPSLLQGVRRRLESGHPHAGS